jgi:hypothetical protein
MTRKWGGQRDSNQPAAPKQGRGPGDQRGKFALTGRPERVTNPALGARPANMLSIDRSFVGRGGPKR